MKHLVLACHNATDRAALARAVARLGLPADVRITYQIVEDRPALTPDELQQLAARVFRETRPLRDPDHKQNIQPFYAPCLKKHRTKR